MFQILRDLFDRYTNLELNSPFSHGAFFKTPRFLRSIQLLKESFIPILKIRVHFRSILHSVLRSNKSLEKSLNCTRQMHTIRTTSLRTLLKPADMIKSVSKQLLNI